MTQVAERVVSRAFPGVEKLSVVTYENWRPAAPLPEDHNIGVMHDAARLVARTGGVPYGGLLNGHLRDEVLLVPLTSPTRKEADGIPREHILGSAVDSPEDGGMRQYYPVLWGAHDLHVLPGWDFEIAKKARDVVGEGYTVFSADDALAAHFVISGSGQSSARTALEPAANRPRYRNYHEIPPHKYAEGVIVTPDNHPIGTPKAVGTLTIDDQQISYLANQVSPTQTETVTNLTVVRGDLAALEASVNPIFLRDVVRKARQMHNLTEGTDTHPTAAEYTVRMTEREDYHDTRAIETSVVGRTVHVVPNTTSALFALEAMQHDPGVQVMRAERHTRRRSYGGNMLEGVPAEDTRVHYGSPHALVYTTVKR